ncbi:MAG TPA: hypothetical protein VFF73_13075 [Planctomycetota bacterium]|nr:hypothetical protein [Planctomycetota bacterium]
MARRAWSVLRSAGRALFGREWIAGSALVVAAFVVPRALFGTEIQGFPTRAPLAWEVVAAGVLGVVLGGLAPSFAWAAILGWIAGAGCLQRTEVLGPLWGAALLVSAIRYRTRRRPSTRARASRREPSLRVNGGAILTYLALVLLAWAAYGFTSGMVTETEFVLSSEHASGLAGFIATQRNRPHLATFYHLAYLVGRATHLKGSFLPYQWVYALLWWARGVLVFLGLSRLLRGGTLVAHVAACLVLAHAADSALNWVGLLIQFAILFWLVLSIYAFTEASLAEQPTRARGFLTLAFFAEYMTLWSYESPIVIVLLVPLLVRPRRRGLVLAWYLIPAIFTVQTVLTYATKSFAGTYQASVLRSDWALASLLHDLGANVSRSLAFWTWSDGFPWSPARALGTWLGLGAVGVFVASSLALMKRPLLPERRVLARMALLAGLVLVASFPVYLLLDSADTFWRTQMLSGLGAGVFTCAVLALVASFMTRESLAALVLLVGGSFYVFCGVQVAVIRGAYHHDIWLRQKGIVGRMLELAPRVKPGTIVVLTGVPEKQDPFIESGLWFDFAVALAYPRSQVMGAYLRRDGSVPPLSLVAVHDGGCYWTHPGSPDLPGPPVPCDAASRISGLESVIAFTYDATGEIQLALRLPPELGPPTDAYRPRDRIEPGRPSRDAERRYLER